MANDSPTCSQSSSPRLTPCGVEHQAGHELRDARSPGADCTSIGPVIAFPLTLARTAREAARTASTISAVAGPVGPSGVRIPKRSGAFAQVGRPNALLPLNLGAAA